MSLSDWTVDWQEKTATHKDGLILKFTPQEEFNQKYDIPKEVSQPDETRESRAPREGRQALPQPEGWMRLVIGGLQGDKPKNVNEILPLLAEGQNAFLEEEKRQKGQAS